MTRLVAIATVLIAIASPTAASGGASSKPAPAGGIVHIRSKPPYFHGYVGAEVPDCQGPRKVKLYQRQNGERIKLGTTQSAGYALDGVWQILIEAEPGSYFAAAPKFRTIDSGTGNPVVCGRAKSRTVALD